MADDHQSDNELFKGLKELTASSFPKKCRTCGRVFVSAEQFFLETQDIRTSPTCLKQSEDDDGSKIVDVFRNCPCGSTLMESFNNRRDLSAAGIEMRRKFESLLGRLEEKNLDRRVARTELIKLLRGEKSEILSKLRKPAGSSDE